MWPVVHKELSNMKYGQFLKTGMVYVEVGICHFWFCVKFSYMSCKLSVLILSRRLVCICSIMLKYFLLHA